MNISQLDGADGMEDDDQKRIKLEQLIKDMDEVKLDSMLNGLQHIIRDEKELLD